MVPVRCSLEVPMNRRSVGLLGLFVVAVMICATPGAAQTPSDKIVLPKLDPQLPPPRPDIPTMPPPRRGAWQEFLESNQFLHAPLFALAFAVVILPLIVLCR